MILNSPILTSTVAPVELCPIPRACLTVLNLIGRLTREDPVTPHRFDDCILLALELRGTIKLLGDKDQTIPLCRRWLNRFLGKPEYLARGIQQCAVNPSRIAGAVCLE